MIRALRMRYHAWRSRRAWDRVDNDTYWHHVLAYHRVRTARDPKKRA